MDLDELIRALESGDPSVLPDGQKPKTRKSKTRPDTFKEINPRVYGYSGKPHRSPEPVAKQPAWHVTPAAEIETRSMRARRKYSQRELEKADYSSRHFVGIYPETVVV